jgi:glucose/arabinose dehydrogenase
MPSPSFRAVIRAVTAIGMLLLAATDGRAQAFLPPGFTDELVVDGLRYSPSMAYLPDDRILVAEKYDARIRLVVNGVLLPEPVAVIDSVVHTPESGLLGIALDPGWPARPYVYAHYNHLNGPRIHIARYTAVGDLAFTGSGTFTLDPASRHLVLADLPDDIDIHNGGNLRFGPDGMLYVSLGDDSNPCRAVLKEYLQGKILRLDVSGLQPGPGGPPLLADITPADNPFVSDPSPSARLVWAYGLRNPYSFQVDLATGQLVIADVGGATWEEVNLQTAPGQNFGYPSFEGPMNTGIVCPYYEEPTSVPPIYAYDRTQFCCGAAVITSPRYRRMGGPYQFPAEYEGDVFVNDVGEGILRRVHFDGTGWALADSVPGQPTALNWGIEMVGVTDYHLHPDGSLYYLRYAYYFQNLTGVIRRIRYDNTVAVPPSSEPRLTFAPPAPTPARSRVTLAFTSAQTGPVRLRIFDLAGRELRQVVEERALSAGRHSREWDLRDGAGRPVGSGVYIARLETGGDVTARKILVVR